MRQNSKTVAKNWNDKMIKSKLSRRNFLQTTALGTLAIGGAAYLGAGALTTQESIARTHLPTTLKIPPLQTGRDEGGTQVYDLTLQNSSTEFFKGIKTKTSGISGSYLGPTLKMRTGKNVRINVTNELGELSTLHWHGMHLPASQDGGPHQLVKSGETWSPEFEIKQKAASLWYHPHHIGKTAEHVWRGMAGMLIIEDDEVDNLGLPNQYGVDDIPLVLQDRTFGSDGSIEYSPSMPSIMFGMIGNTPLANGTLSAFFETKSKLLRLRILNGSNASFYNLGFANDKPFKQIATDGGLLEQPVELTRLVLAPGERAEIIVEMNNSETAVFRNYKWTATTTGNSGGMGGMMGGGMMGGGMMGNAGVTPE
ncbi:MAG: multicopper oxidase domain-containing protein, partial [Rhizobiaceae bacterium]|nr:multicopper oxidase domain-containing protein [Rhizobiaceae bacterium]